MRGSTIAIKWASDSVTKDRSGITHLCNVSDYPTDPRKKWDIPNIRW